VKWMRLLLLLALPLGVSLATAARDPGASEDARIERDRVLKASDQLDVISSQMERLQTEVQTLRSNVEKLGSENASLRESLTALENGRKADREALLDEVTRILSEQSPKKGVHKNPAPDQGKSNPPTPEGKLEPKQGQATPEKKAEPAGKRDSAGEDKGYEHVVQAGQTVTKIARAFRAQGVNVTAEEIIRANRLDANGTVRIGQKLFIPKK
jgi:regulator of replication initiation timing